MTSRRFRKNIKLDLKMLWIARIKRESNCKIYFEGGITSKKRIFPKSWIFKAYITLLPPPPTHFSKQPVYSNPSPT